MNPKYNREEFYRLNDGLPHEGWGDSAFNYANYIQFRLNNNLLLLSDPKLASELGISREVLLRETRKLYYLSSLVEIPEIVDETQKRGFLRR